MWAHIFCVLFVSIHSELIMLKSESLVSTVYILMHQIALTSIKRFEMCVG